MAQGYRHVPRGMSRVAAKTRDLQRQLDSQRTAANINNSAITSGSGLTVKDANGQSIQLGIASDGTSEIFFSPPTASQVSDWVAAIGFDPDGSYGGGELTLTSPGPPVFRATDTPAQTGFINLTSGDGVSSPASVGLTVENAALQVIDSFSGNPAHIAIGAIGTFAGVREDSSSWRLVGNSAALVLPQLTSEFRIRDANDTFYTVIRASAFTVSSTREAKQDVTDLGWSAADVVAKAKAQRWRYKPEHADPDRVHFGPMAEDLPDELVDHGDPDVPGVNTADLIGVLWAAVGELTARVAELEAAQA